ncbi:MAG: NAD(P)H-hydrate dehydratase [Sulfolobales archaeon]
MVLNISWREAVDTVEMRALEINSSALGVTTLLLMENAGRSVAEEIGRRFRRGSRILVVAGRGGKAGDGFVAARHLKGLGYQVDIMLTSDPESVKHEDARYNLEVLIRSGWKMLRYEGSIPQDYDVIIDALLGTGVRGRVTGSIAEIIRGINSSKSYRVSIDLPSGLDPDSGEDLGICVRADLTITMHAPKKGLLKNKECVGELVVADIGIPPEAWEEIGPGDVEARVRKRERISKKGDSGRVLVIGGSYRYVGAPWITAMAAWAAGSDLVYLASPERVLERAFSPEIIPVELKSEEINSNSIEVLRELIGRVDSIAIGPGIGLSKNTREGVKEILEEISRKGVKVVIDADALKILSELDIRFNWKAILTPHLGEASILLNRSIGNDPDSRREAAKEISSKYEAVVVLKGFVDYVCESSRCRSRSIIGNPDMARGGTGDVLTGVIASLIPRTRTIFEAACAGVIINAMAGELAYMRKGISSPQNLIEIIPEIMKDPLKTFVEIINRKTSKKE